MPTRWRPDTCDCVIDVHDWNDESKSVVVSACNEHGGLGANGAQLVHHENQRFASPARNSLIKQNVSFDRVIVRGGQVVVEGVPTEQRPAADAAVVSAIGPNKHRLV